MEGGGIDTDWFKDLCDGAGVDGLFEVKCMLDSEGTFFLWHSPPQTTKQKKRSDWAKTKNHFHAFADEAHWPHGSSRINERVTLHDPNGLNTAHKLFNQCNGLHDWLDRSWPLAPGSALYNAASPDAAGADIQVAIARFLLYYLKLTRAQAVEGGEGLTADQLAQIAEGGEFDTMAKQILEAEEEGEGEEEEELESAGDGGGVGGGGGVRGIHATHAAVDKEGRAGEMRKIAEQQQQQIRDDSKKARTFTKGQQWLQASAAAAGKGGGGGAVDIPSFVRGREEMVVFTTRLKEYRPEDHWPDAPAAVSGEAIALMDEGWEFFSPIALGDPDKEPNNLTSAERAFYIRKVRETIDSAAWKFLEEEEERYGADEGGESISGEEKKNFKKFVGSLGKISTNKREFITALRSNAENVTSMVLNQRNFKYVERVLRNAALLSPTGDTADYEELVRETERLFGDLGEANRPGSQGILPKVRWSHDSEGGVDGDLTTFQRDTVDKILENLQKILDQLATKYKSSLNGGGKTRKRRRRRKRNTRKRRRNKRRKTKRKRRKRKTRRRY